jgi:hypothetical protein
MIASVVGTWKNWKKRKRKKPGRDWRETDLRIVDDLLGPLFFTSLLFKSFRFLS